MLSDAHIKHLLDMLGLEHGSGEAFRTTVERTAHRILLRSLPEINGIQVSSGTVTLSDCHIQGFSHGSALRVSGQGVALGENGSLIRNHIGVSAEGDQKTRVILEDYNISHNYTGAVACSISLSTSAAGSCNVNSGAAVVTVSKSTMHNHCQETVWDGGLIVHEHRQNEYSTWNDYAYESWDNIIQESNSRKRRHEEEKMTERHLRQQEQERKRLAVEEDWCQAIALQIQMDGPVCAGPSGR